MTGLQILPASAPDIGRTLPPEAVDGHGHSHLHRGLAAAACLGKQTLARGYSGTAVATTATTLDTMPGRHAQPPQADTVMPADRPRLVNGDTATGLVPADARPRSGGRSDEVLCKIWIAWVATPEANAGIAVLAVRACDAPTPIVSLTMSTMGLAGSAGDAMAIPVLAMTTGMKAAKAGRKHFQRSQCCNPCRAFVFRGHRCWEAFWNTP